MDPRDARRYSGPSEDQKGDHLPGPRHAEALCGQVAQCPASTRSPRAIKDSRQGPGRPLQWGVPPNGPNRRHNPRRFGPHVRAYASDCEQGGGARPSLLDLLSPLRCVAFTACPTDAPNFAQDATFRSHSGNAPEAVGRSPDDASGLMVHRRDLGRNSTPFLDWKQSSLSCALWHGVCRLVVGQVFRSRHWGLSPLLSGNFWRHSTPVGKVPGIRSRRHRVD